MSDATSASDKPKAFNLACPDAFAAAFASDSAFFVASCAANVSASASRCATSSAVNSTSVRSPVVQLITSFVAIVFSFCYEFDIPYRDTDEYCTKSPAAVQVIFNEVIAAVFDHNPAKRRA